MFEIVTNKAVIATTKTGKIMLKVFCEKYFCVIAFMIDPATADSLNKAISGGSKLHISCFYNFKSIFGNLVRVSDDKGTVIYSV